MPGFSVEGPDGIAGPPTRPPVVVAGVDGTGKIRRLLTGTDGTVQVSAAGGGGATTIADGADVAQGSTADVAWVSGAGTVISLLKKIASAGGSAVSVADGADVAQGTTTDLSSANTMIGILKAIKAAITGTLTVSGAVTTGGLTDTQIRATPLPVSGTVTTGGLTDTQIRATPLPVSGTVTANATLAAETTKVIGTVNVAASQTITVTQATATNLKVDASGVAVPVTDNSGSLTVDAPVATPVFTRLSDGAAALIGQKAMTASLPVVLASDQASVPVAATLAAETTKVIGTVNVAAAQTIAATQATAANLNATVVQGTAAAVSGGWPVKVTDGTNTQPTGDTVGRAIFHKVTDGTTAVKVTVANAQPANTDGALLVNAIDTFAGTAIASASHGVATVNTDIVNYNGKGIRVWQDLTVLGASSVCQFSIQEKDPVSGKFITLLASAATGAGINSTGTAKLTIYPGLTAAANVTASDVIPMNIRIVSTVTTAASTFSQGYSIIP